MGNCSKFYAYLSVPQWRNSASISFNEVNTVQREHWFKVLYLWGDQYVLQAFVQRQILRSECRLKSNCSTSFLDSPCFCCLFTFCQSLNLFCYFQPSHFISTYTFPWKWCLGFRGCLLVVIQPLSLRSLLQHSFAMPFHPLPSYCRASFELFKSGLGYCSIPFKMFTKPCPWFA